MRLIILILKINFFIFVRPITGAKLGTSDDYNQCKNQIKRNNLTQLVFNTMIYRYMVEVFKLRF